jgi:hypothetical protein
VARAHRWTPVLLQSGNTDYFSDPFTVAAHWRIVFRLRSGGEWRLPVAQISWANDSSWFPADGFIAHGTGARTVPVNGAGNYRLAVSASPGANWQLEVDTYH